MNYPKIYIGAALIALFYATAPSNIGAQNDSAKYSESDQLLYNIGGDQERFLLYPDPYRNNFAIVTRNIKKNGLFFTSWDKSGKVAKHPEFITHASFSSNGEHTAYVLAGKKGSKYVEVDGKKYGPFYEVADDTVVFSNDGSRWTFAATKSPEDKKDCYVYTDGKKSKAYNTTTGPVPEFSPSGKKSVYFARTDDEKFPVIDGVEGPRYPATGWGPYYAGEDEKVVFAGIGGGKAYVYVGDSIVGTYKQLWGDIVVDPNDNSLWLSARNDSTYHIFHDGEQIDNAYQACCPQISEDGRHTGYWATDGDKEWFVIDMQDDPHFDCIELFGLSFGKYGLHYAYNVLVDSMTNTQILVYDGKPIDTLAGQLDHVVAYFFPDSNSFAYRWDADSTTEYLVINGEKHHYAKVFDCAFTGDGKHFGYVAKTNPDDTTCFLVLDGENVTNKECFIWDFTYVPNSDLPAYFTEENGKVYLTIGSQEFRRFDHVYNQEVKFDDDGSIRFFAEDEKNIYEVTISPN